MIKTYTCYEEVLKDYTPLLYSLWKKYCYRYKQLDQNEVDQLLKLTLWKAWLAQQKDIASNEKTYALGTYLTYQIQNTLKEFTKKPKEQIVDQDSFKNYVLGEIEQVEYKEDINAVLQTLDPTEQQLINMLYYEDRTMDYCANKLNKSIARLNRIHKIALSKLKWQLEIDPL